MHESQQDVRQAAPQWRGTFLAGRLSVGLLSMHRLLGSKLIGLSAGGLLALAGCAPPPVQQVRLQHFGTEIEIKLGLASEAEAREIFQRLDGKLADWHRRWHAWQPSELTAINQKLASGEAVALRPDLAGLLRRSQQYASESDGLFNPAIGQRLAAWGFQQADPTATTPAPAPIDPATLPRMSALVIDADQQLHSEDRTVQLDLGGIAKGYAMNALLADLRASHVDSAMISLGGDIGVLGDFRGRPWKIGILAGAVDDTPPLAALQLRDGELAFSSGTYARRHDTGDGGSAHHILDPRTGNPALGNRAATVLGADGERLQVASKVLLIAGADWRSYADKLQTPLALVVTAEGVIEVTEALAVRLEASAEERAKWRVVK
ncbi:FAD:protein FMN transferase [Permianibacter sp. IMCC34836]|uniref:FAD:protein FMN transferase n=1 Tax=Permianibacter fluminis TaxID=2738515 RepID=UPI0015534569|nr:FAD:protein FMN transferase [Permianibacter fluminis]NQD35806.1 FAD:protein FMN transferase [Permianibacter fluminis]